MQQEDDLPLQLSFEERLAIASRRAMVPIAPGVDAYEPAPGVTDPPTYVLAKFALRKDGTYRCIPNQIRMARVNDELMALLGFPSSNERPAQYQTLRRLANAGFTEMVQISPGTWMLDVDGWFRLMRYCVQNPDCWEKGSEDRKTYLFRNNLGEWRARR